MELSFSGGPFAGRTLNAPSAPEFVEFPLYTTNGGCIATARYQRIKSSSKFEFVGKETTKEPIEPGEQKSVVIRKTKTPQHDKHGKGHMEWDNKKGRYIVKEEKKNG